MNIAVGCSSAKFRNGSFITLGDDELDKRTSWARAVVQEAHGSLEPFTDLPEYGATRTLPKSFQRATAMAKRIGIEQLEEADLDGLLTRATSPMWSAYYLLVGVVNVQ